MQNFAILVREFTQMRYIFIFFIIISFSCKKKSAVAIEKEERVFTAIRVDTIKPNSYLPVYPGSWWKYVNEKGEYVINTTEPEYVKDTYRYFSLQESKYYTSYPSFVPVYMGRKIWGRLEHKDIHYPWDLGKDLIPVVSDSLSVGTVWTTYYENSLNAYYSKIIHKDTAIIIAGKTYSPTIVLQLSTGNGFSHLFPYRNEYYTKNIGMVRSEDMIWSKPDSVTSYMNIVAYLINR